MRIIAKHELISSITLRRSDHVKAHSEGKIGKIEDPRSICLVPDPSSEDYSGIDITMGRLLEGNNKNSNNNDTPLSNHSDRIETFEDDEPAPSPALPPATTVTHTTTFFSRLYNLRRGGGRRSSNHWVPQHDPPLVVLDEEDLMEKQHSVESADATYFSMHDVYLYDIDADNAEKEGDKDDTGSISQQPPRFQNGNQEARGESIPGAFRVTPAGGPAPTSLHRYDSNADLHVEDFLRPPQEEILVEASIVPPSTPDLPQGQLPALLELQHPVVEAKPMVRPPKDAITLNKRRVIILVCVVAIVITTLAIGLGASLTTSMDQSNSTQSAAFDAVNTTSPNSSQTKQPEPPRNDSHGGNGGSSNGGEGGGGGSYNGGQGGSGTSDNNRRLRR